ncbi:MAG TPA: serine hydrolase domain-containing protein [Bryobacteraceae bacterium]|nr:serine hydrolase domain-containing protein [Bryobacteraceae bacterium]
MKCVPLVISLLACAAIAAPQAPSRTPAEKLTADKEVTTARGATFTAPGGWSIVTSGPLVILEPPEADSHIVIFDTDAATADAAINEAWAAYKPGEKRPIRQKLSPPAREGWEEVQVYLYETSPNERAVVQAMARRSKNTWTVIIGDGKQPTFEKRGAAIGQILGSLRPASYQRESFAGRKAGALNAARLAQMDEFIQMAIKKLDIPGVAVAYIDGGKVLLEGAYGVKELGKPNPINVNTLFMAASNTKGMTTLLLAKLVDEGKVKWDDYVTKAYPKFKLGDAKTTEQVRIEHLICACTGLPRQDLPWLFEFRKATPAYSMEMLGKMQPTSGFGEVFQYSNIMASGAGYIAGYLYNPKLELGAAYDEAMRKKIFQPLQMHSTTFDYARALSGDHANPHSYDVDGKQKVASMDLNYSVQPHRPAGGVWTSAHDLIRYVLLELAKGRLPNGKVLVSETNLLARRKPRVKVGAYGSYGMGLQVENRWGTPMVFHGGSMLGFKSDIMFLPEHGVGAVILTNSDTGGLLLGPFKRRLLEVLFDGKPEAAEDLATAAKNYKAIQAKFRERLVVPADKEPVARLAARYTSPDLGELTVSRAESSTIFDLGEWRSSVATRKNDDGTISFITIDPGASGFEFVEAKRNNKRALIVREGQHEYVFTETL